MNGQLISGRYQLDVVLGRGGMATVWRGVDERLGRDVAVKLLDRAAADAAMLQRFDREARTAGGLTHPNIVAVYDVGTDSRGPYLVMELIDGTSVAALLAGGPLPIDQVVDVARQICDALAVAHAQGVVHRDIKPANILITTTGTVKVCDFGIARLTHQEQTDLTAPHTAIGTSAYMAPEQASGAAVDARTDLYALGCVMYAMLTGHPPFTGDNPLTVLWQHQHQPAPAVASRRADTPADIDALIARLLAKNPSGPTRNRYRGARPAHGAWRERNGGRPTDARHPGGLADPDPASPGRRRGATGPRRRSIPSRPSRHCRGRPRCRDSRRAYRRPAHRVPRPRHRCRLNRCG
jgi:eukaryotic-like serine/threonine-protein kinase